MDRIKNLKKQDLSILALCFLFFLVSAFFYQFGFYQFNSSNSNLNQIGQIASTKSDVRHKVSKTYFWTEAKDNTRIGQGDSLFVGQNSNSRVKLKDGKEFLIGENSLVKFNFKNNDLSLEMGFGQIQAVGLNQKIKITECGKVYEIDASQADLLITKADDCSSLGVQVNKGQIKVNNKTVEKTAKLKKLSEDDKRIDIASAPVIEKPQPQVEPMPVAPPLPAPKIVEAPKLFKKKQNILVDEKSKPKIEWEFMDDIAEYQIEISPDSLFDHVSLYRSKTNSLPITKYDSEQIYYRVKAKSNDGIESSYSEVGQMQFEFPSIVLNDPDKKLSFVAKNSKDLGSPQKLEVSWNPIKAANEYIIEVDTNPEFSNPQKTNLRSPAGTLTVPKGGQYHYRVSALGQSGRQISSSNVGVINYDKVFDLIRPNINETSKNLTYYFQKGLAKFIWLRWNDQTPSEKIQHYRLEIAKDASFQQKIKAYNTKKPQFLLNETLEKGQYFWRVRSENKDQFSDWSEAGHLKVYLENTPSIPLNSAPAQQ